MYANPYQQQLNQYQQQYQQYTQPNIKVSYVMSKEEANVQIVPMDGSLTVFINPTLNEIYTKKLGNNGLPEFLTYKLKSQSQNTVNIDSILSEVEKIKKDVKELKTNAKSNESNTISKSTKK